MLEEGSLTAHVTIVARAMGVPVLGRVPRRAAARSPRATCCCSTSAEGSVFVRPSAAMEEAFDAKLALRQKRKARVRRAARRAAGDEGRRTA